MKKRKRKPFHQKLKCGTKPPRRRTVPTFRIVGAPTKMMIKLTETGTSKNTFALDAGLVAWCARRPDNQLESIVALKMGGPTGPLSFTVLESPEEVQRLVNAALGGKDLSLS